MPWRRLLLRLHRWLGLVLALPLLGVAISGALLAAGKPLDERLNASLFQAPASKAVGAADVDVDVDADADADADVDAVQAALRARYGANTNTTLRLPQQPGESLRVFVRSPGFSGMAFFDPATARWLGQRGDTEGWWPWLFELHSEALAGETGKNALSLLAAGGIVLMLLGAAIAWPRRGRPALSVAWQAPVLRRFGDLHRVAGLIAVPLLLVLVLTGLYMAWTPLRGWVSHAVGERPFKPPALPPVATPSTAAPPALSLLVASAQARWPEARVVYITQRAAQPTRVRLKLNEDPHPNGLSSVWLDPRNGQELAHVRFDQLDAGQRWVSWIYPLHAAKLLPVLQRPVWAALGVVAAALAASGAWLWWRRRTSRISAPAAERPRSA